VAAAHDWLKLVEVHRRHLGTAMRDADREVTLHRGGLPETDSMSLAAHLLGTLTTPSQAAVKAETRLLVQETLNGMESIDREVLPLKHFEQLSTSEIVAVTGSSSSAILPGEVAPAVGIERLQVLGERRLLLVGQFLLGPRRQRPGVGSQRQ
jgi:hypothetical protein